MNVSDSPQNTGITRRTKPPAQINQSIRDAIECLLEMASLERPVGSRELARRLDQDHSRVNRIISTLSYMGLADQTADRKYVAGAGLLVLASMSLRSSPLYRCAIPHLERLGAQTGYQVALGLRWRTNVSYLFHGQFEEHAALGIAAEGLYPASESSIGLVLLSQLENEAIEALYRGDIAHSTDDTHMKTLFKRLEKAKRNGYAIAPNHRSIAVALGDPAIAGIALYHAEDQDKLPKDKNTIRAFIEQLENAARCILLDMARK
jgi:DNA-binding IclR family transcriptional regulator